jgi:hypothetical protein
MSDADFDRLLDELSSAGRRVILEDLALRPRPPEWGTFAGVLLESEPRTRQEMVREPLKEMCARRPAIDEAAQLAGAIRDILARLAPSRDKSALSARVGRLAEPKRRRGSLILSSPEHFGVVLPTRASRAALTAARRAGKDNSDRLDSVSPPSLGAMPTPCPLSKISTKYFSRRAGIPATRYGQIPHS